MDRQRSFSSDRDIVEFCSYLRSEGFNIGVKETLDVIRSCTVFTDQNWQSVRLATRAVLSSSKDVWDRFDTLFEIFWGRAAAGCNPDKQNSASQREWSRNEKPDEENERGVGIAIGRTSESGEQEEGRSVSGASPRERLRKTDFSKLPPTDVAELERVALRLLNRMSFRLSRRLKIATEGQLDLRRTIRRSVGRGGDPVDLRYRGKKRRRPKLVVMIDVSGSMQLHRFFLLMLAYALQKHFKGAQSFVFSTGPVEVTDSLNSNSLRDSLTALSG
ncbi:MAG: VWA domain-containing protein, partial [Blastocatellia bacterium]